MNRYLGVWTSVGMGAMVIGLGLAVLAVWVRPPSLACSSPEAS